MQDEMIEAKIRKLKELKRMIQKRMVDDIDVEDMDTVASDLLGKSPEKEMDYDNYDKKGMDYEESEYEMQRGEGLEEGGEGLEEGLLEKMIESMRGKRPKKEYKSAMGMIPPKPSVMISVSSTSKPMGKKGKRRKA